MTEKEEPSTLRLSFSGASTWLSCRRKWYFNYKENLVGKETSRALEVGAVTHYLLHKWFLEEITLEDIQNLNETLIEFYPDMPPQEAVSIAMECSQYLLGYIDKYQNDPIKVISSEMKIESEVIEPKTLKPYRIYGIIDAVCRTPDQRLWRLEHKTAGSIDSFYLNGLRNGLQGGIYHYLLNKTMPEPVVGTIYNMIVKTKIPKYERMPVFMESILAARALATFHGIARDIFLGDIYPNADACFSYNRNCTYLPLCNAWKGQWDKNTLRIKESFFKPKEERR